jgi:DNA-binding transcriptional regulator YiaG
MPISWIEIEKMRSERGLEIADLARRSGLAERTIYYGIKNNSRLRGATKQVLRNVFPEEFARLEGGAA